MEQNKNTISENKDTKTTEKSVKTDNINYKTIISNKQELLILVVTICIVVFSIFKFAFKGTTYSCENYVLSTYLYVLLGLIITAFTTLPRELEMMILSYIPITIVFTEEQLGKYNFFLVNNVKDGFDFSLIPDIIRNNGPFIPINDDPNCFIIKFNEEQFNLYREIVLKEVRNDLSLFSFVCEKLRGDQDFIYEVFDYNDYMVEEFVDIFFENISEELKNDREFMIKFLSDYILPLSVDCFSDAFEHISEELLNDRDREFVLKVLQYTTTSIIDFDDSFFSNSEELNNYREIILTAVRYYGYAFGYASIELHNDREIVLTAVRGDGHDGSVASKELKNDREIVLAAGLV